MVGGGSRRDESVVINSTNVFAALGSLKKKKKDKDQSQQGSSSKAKKNEEKKEKELIWTPAKLNVKSWADVDDDDEDDYYATTASAAAPPDSPWAAAAVKESDAEPVDEVKLFTFFFFVLISQFVFFLSFSFFYLRFGSDMYVHVDFGNGLW